MTANYDNTVWFYDTLATLVYGKNIIKAQKEFLNLIPPHSRVLIVGGGTGKILEEVAKVHPAGLTIFYAEVSEKMLSKSIKRSAGKSSVVFYNQPVEDMALANIDVAITPFLFDNFDGEYAEKIFRHIDSMTSENALWLNTDFQLTGKWWQVVLLKSMLLFFKLFGAVNNKRTTDMQPVFEKYGYKKIACKTFYGDFIRSEAWQKPA
ncbi:class I SAM-dependent methyltransferase [Mucilaginibacter ginkgonis]|uniref:Class I SAM-dependent methyltransferase n=1 Tax=Mucilaginibacter ginkgonis TaxID=2682091 RepID=A0A6I4I069_9SPHI|nr:class I SAM-dependent methyltransferase [Mucilaginibacter ginkgonis]QQL48306.1 class I SAM-dependent methyltransferase [Mucilaginibacter ginkgonis]